MKAYCEICNLHFVSDADLNRHNRYHHMSKYDGTAEERTFLSATAELTTTAHRHISLRPQQVNKWLISQLVMYHIGRAKKWHYFYWVTTMNHEISHYFCFIRASSSDRPINRAFVSQSLYPRTYAHVRSAKRLRGVFNMCVGFVNTQGTSVIKVRS